MAPRISRLRRLQPDLGRLANAVSRPGIDPRIWVSYATVTSEPYIETDEGVEDIFVDVRLHPSEQLETARVGTIYAGDGFGFYTPLHQDDEVLIGAPSGDPDEGLVVIQRLWSPFAVPPPEVVENPEDVTLVVQEGKNVRIVAMGGGDLIIDTVDGSGVSINVQGDGNVNLNVDQGKVYLGSEGATRGVARLDDTTLNGTLELSAVAVPPVPPAPPGVVLNLTYTPPGGGVPVVSSVTLAIATLIASLGSIPLSGKIDSASNKVVSE